MQKISDRWLAVCSVKLSTHRVGVQFSEVDVVIVLPQTSLQLSNVLLHLATQLTLHLLQHLRTTVCDKVIYVAC